MSEGPEGGPLQAQRVLDLSRLVPGQACSWYLAGHGAEVWRVEPPGGDPLRHLGPFDADGTGAWFAWAHRGKRSVVADLRTAAGRALVRALAARVDVLLESHRPGVMASMGLDPAILVAEESTLIVASQVRCSWNCMLPSFTQAANRPKERMKSSRATVRATILARRSSKITSIKSAPSSGSQRMRERRGMEVRSMGVVRVACCVLRVA